MYVPKGETPRHLMKATIIALLLSTGMLAQGLVMGNEVKQQAMEVQTERLGAYCDAGLESACRELVEITGGQCAGPQGSGCGYDSAVYN